MSLVEIILAMVSTGCTPEQIAAVTKAYSVSDDAKSEKRKERNRRYYEKTRLIKTPQDDLKTSESVLKTSENDPSRVRERVLCGEEISIIEPSVLPLTPKPIVRRSSVAFDRFWQAWPHRVGKPAALRAFAAAERRPKFDLETILAGVENYIRTKPPDRQWLNPATFLNQERWADQPAAAQPNGTQNGKRTLHDAARDLEAKIIAQTQFDLGLGPVGGDVVMFPGNGGEARPTAARLLSEGGGGGSGRVYGGAGYRAPEIS